jgi:hypothetical protein
MASDTGGDERVLTPGGGDAGHGRRWFGTSRGRDPPFRYLHYAFEDSTQTDLHARTATIPGQRPAPRTPD